MARPREALRRARYVVDEVELRDEDASFLSLEAEFLDLLLSDDEFSVLEASLFDSLSAEDDPLAPPALPFP